MNILFKTKKSKVVLSIIFAFVFVVTSANYGNDKKVYAASANVSGIEIDTTSDMVLYLPDNATSGYSVTDTEAIYTTLSGGTEYEKLEYQFEAYNIDGVAGSNLFSISKSVKNSVSAVGFSGGKATVTLKNSSEDIPAFAIAAGSSVTEGAVLDVTVSLWVKNRTNPYVRRCSIVAETGLVPAIGVSVNASQSFISVDDEITITNKVEPSNCNANIKYKVAKTGTTTKEIISGNVHRVKSSDSKTLYATYNDETGYFKAEVSGKYTITPTSTAWLNGTAYTYPATIYVVGTAFDNMAVEEGRTAGNINGLKDVSGTLDTSSTYVVYDVEDSDIASVSYNSSSYGTKLSITGKQIGYTKVTATVKTYDNVSSAGTFTQSAYIAVAPKSSDKTFDINNIEHKEAYINELVKANKANQVVLKSAVKGIIEGTIDCKKLSYEAYELIEECMEADYPYHYAVNNSAKTDKNKTTVVANGLTIAYADNDILNVKDPVNPVELKLVCSDVLSQQSSYKLKNAITSFTASLSAKNQPEQNEPLWIAVTNTGFNNGDNYTVYLNGKAIYTTTAADRKVKFVTDELGVFSIAKAQSTLTTSYSEWLNEDTLAKEEVPAIDMAFAGYVEGYGEIEEDYDESTGIINVGTHGESRRIESLEINGISSDDIKMTAHVQNKGDLTQTVTDDGTIVVGCPGEGLRMEAFSIELLNDYAKYYDIYYRVHVQEYGWLGWAKNGEIAGTSGHSFRIESIEIKVVKKGEVLNESLYQKTHEQGDRGKSGSSSYMDR